MKAHGGFAAIYRPTLSERLWRAIGFRYHLGEEPPDLDGDALQGWMVTEAVFSFTLADRLRLLLTGRLRVRTTCYTDTPSPSVCKNRLDWQIHPPGGRS